MGGNRCSRRRSSSCSSRSRRWEINHQGRGCNPQFQIFMLGHSPEGGPWPAYPSGKSWDEPSGKTGSGKKFYHNVIPGSQVATEPFYVAIITPVIHYCMGGLETSAAGEVVKANG